MKKLLEEVQKELMKIKALTYVIDEKLVNIDSTKPPHRAMEDMDALIQMASMAYEMTDSLEDKIDKALVQTFKNDKSE